MGLDLKLSRKGYELFTGNGRTEFAFVKKWVQSKGDDFYGEDTLLTKEDIKSLIELAYAQKEKNGISREDFKKMITDSYQNSKYILNAEELVGKLMLIDEIKNYTDYYLECDW